MLRKVATWRVKAVLPSSKKNPLFVFRLFIQVNLKNSYEFEMIIRRKRTIILCIYELIAW